MKIALIGAGGVIFSQNFMRDLLLSPELRDSELALMDINAERLEHARQFGEILAGELKVCFNPLCTTDLREAVRGAKYVFTIFRCGNIRHQELEYAIPAKYGVKQVVGDTLGPGGIFRGLRTLKPLFEVLSAMEELAPGAYLLNYVNPMSINTIALSARARTVKVIGLCHSVPSAREQMAKWLEIPEKELDFTAAGVNHLAFILKLAHRGIDVYPKLRECLNKPEIYNQQKVQFEIFRHFGYYPTEGSGHNSEYTPYFRKRGDLLDKFCGCTYTLPDDDIRWSPVASGEPGAAVECCKLLQIRNEKRIRAWLSGEEKIELKPSHEYGMQIVHAIECNELMQANLNVINRGLIPALPDGAAVEVPCLVDGSGIHACRVEDFPEQLAALDRSMTSVQLLTARGALNCDRRDIFFAMAADPVTQAVLGLDEIQSMTDEMFAALATEIDPRFSVR